MSLFSVILENELERRGLTAREAARQIGISHTTLYAIKNGARSADIQTVLAIARWVGVPLSVLVKEADPDAHQQDALTAALKMVLRSEPDLERVFLDAARELDSGVLTLGDFSEIVSYAAYKIRTRREQARRE